MAARLHTSLRDAVPIALGTLRRLRADRVLGCLQALERLTDIVLHSPRDSFGSAAYFRGQSPFPVT